MFKKLSIFFIGALCAWALFFICGKKANSQDILPSNLYFVADNNALYFLDKDNAKIYLYNNSGRFMRSFVITELGKNFSSAY